MQKDQEVSSDTITLKIPLANVEIFKPPNAMLGITSIQYVHYQTQIT